ncbi:hypothetical protein [Streptomyces canus]|uniref:hypothetical protein n=1 Tax=Streptomyces canus TaxID=58343 RepID=UPI00324E9496
MARRIHAAGQWLRDRQAEGVVRVIARSPDRAASLDRLADRIDDRVIGALLNESYRAEIQQDWDEAAGWADLASQASLLGGTSRGRAEALTWQGRLLLDTFDRTTAPGSGSTGSPGGALPDSAAEAVGAALEIYRRIGPPEDLLTAQQLTVRIHRARGAGMAALDGQLRCVRIAADITDETRATAVTGRLATMYWSLAEDDLRAGAELLLTGADDALAQARDRRTSADLLDAMGHAHQQLGAVEPAFTAWSAAAGLYRECGPQSDEFLVLSRMFDYAVEQEQVDRAREYGEASFRAVPTDIKPELLADRLHRLACIHVYLDRTDEAINILGRAVEASRDVPHSYASTLFLLDKALLEVQLGRLGDGRRNLEQVAATGLEYLAWVADAHLTDLLMNSGDLGAAAAHADAALQLTITSIGAMACRAHSLHRSGLVHMRAGDAETAYRRFSQLMPILARNPEPTALRGSRLQDHPVIPPPRAQSAWWAHLACEATGRKEEAAVYLRLHLELISRAVENPQLPGAEELWDTAEYQEAAAQVREFSTGMSLYRSDPGAALACFGRAVESTVLSDQPWLVAQAHQLSASCHVRLGDDRAAAASFGRALETMPPGTEFEIEWPSRAGLAGIALREKRFEVAYKQLIRCVRITEESRSSLTGVNERADFLSAMLPFYDMLVMTCVRLDRPEEALDAVQQIKSRTLLDLLSVPTHRPIDPTLGKRLADLKRDQEDWLSEYGGEPVDRRVDVDYLQSREYQKLDNIVSRQKERAKVEQDVKDRGLFQKLEAQGAPVSFAAIRSMLDL